MEMIKRERVAGTGSQSEILGSDGYGRRDGYGEKGDKGIMG